MARKNNVARQEDVAVQEPVETIESPVTDEQIVEHVGETDVGTDTPTDEGPEVTLIEEELPPVTIDLRVEADIMKLGEIGLIAHYGSKSKAIRGLNALGHKCGPISRALNIRFQHARNVLLKPLKREIAAERKAAAKAE